MHRDEDSHTVPVGNVCPNCRKVPGTADDLCASCGLYGVPAGELAHGRSAPFLGHLVERRYVLVGLVGSGGMGAVYRARQLGIGRDVAFKLMHAGGRATDAARERFKREARVVAGLESDHTVKVFDFGEVSEGPLAGALYMVMDLVEGISLAHRLRQGPLPLDEIALLLAHMADSVDEAHGKGIIHRDLKPSNILLTAYQGRPRVKVIDFGIARVEDSDQTINGTALGTPSYMAPELWPSDAPRPITGRADVYAMGVVLYQMLTGFKPFRSRDLLVLAACHRSQPVPSFAGHDPILGALEPVVFRAMEKDPDARYPSLAAMAEDFDHRLAAVMRQYGQTESLSIPFMTPSGRAEFTTRDSRSSSGSSLGSMRPSLSVPGAERPGPPPPHPPAPGGARWPAVLALLAVVAAGGVSARMLIGGEEPRPDAALLDARLIVHRAPDVTPLDPDVAIDAAAPDLGAVDARPTAPPDAAAPKPATARTPTRREPAPATPTRPPKSPSKPASTPPTRGPSTRVSATGALLETGRSQLEQRLLRALDACKCARARTLHGDLKRQAPSRAAALDRDIDKCIYRLDTDTRTCAPR